VSNGLRALTDDDLNIALERLLAPRLADLIRGRSPGHCMRVTEVDAALAIRLCQRIRGMIGPAGQVWVLGEAGSDANEVTISSTKLVELRNPGADGTPRPPLLVFVPPGVHASAEDSFGVATFAHVDLGDVYAELAANLQEALPDQLRDGITQLFGALREQRWPYADSVARARFLLTVAGNNYDLEAAGGAIFELGLIPDSGLFTDPRTVRTWTARNLHCTTTITNSSRPARQRVVELELTDPAFRARLASFLAKRGTEDDGLANPRAWTRHIVVDRTNWPLMLRSWPLRDETTPAAVRIQVGELSLPRAGEPQHADDPVLQNISGQLYLPTGGQGINQLTVTFQVSPDPRHVAGLARFAVQLVSEDGGPTGVTTRVQVSTIARTTYRANLKRLRTAGLEAGWHYVRVLPVDVDGLPLPVESPAPGQRDNESDRFFVIPDGDVDEPPPQRARRDVGVTHALMRLAFEAQEQGRDSSAIELKKRAWRHGAQSGQVPVLDVSFGAFGMVEIPLSPPLTAVQRAILDDPERRAQWRLPVDLTSSADALHPIDLPWPPLDADPVHRFRAARRQTFAAVRDSEGAIVEGCDLRILRDSAREYAESYSDLLAWQLRRAERADDDELPSLLQELSGLLRLDTMSVEHIDVNDTHHEVILVAPTHPLRMLWLVTWTELGQRWLEQANGQEDAGKIRTAAEALLDLTPTGFPLAVPFSGGRLAVAATDLTPYWGAHLSSGTDDPQSVLSGVAATLRLPELPDNSTALSGRRLADRIERYLRLHPYVTTLAINVINPGPAEQLANALVELQGRAGCQDINYDIRLFTPDSHRSGAGRALAALLDGDWSQLAEAEVFHVPTPGIVPKLRVAIRPLAEFSSVAGESSAHLTILFDAFGGEQIDAVASFDPAPPPLHGLRQDMTVEYVRDGELISWRKRPRHGTAHALPGAEELSDLLSALPALVSHGNAAVATGQVGNRAVPRITLSLTARDRALLHQAHVCSDWVLTVDRTLGIDYFDEPGNEERSHYVIDYDVDAGSNLRHQVVLSSRSVDELKALLAPAIRQHGFSVDDRHVASFFDQLRLLSGRLAFKLASATPTQRTEAIGLALARLFLDYQGALADQIVVPLDAHLELYQEARRRPDTVGDPTSLRRSDLALFSLDAQRRQITCRIVEVKCYSELADPAAYQRLKEQMRKQIDGSERVLRDHFDPHQQKSDRLDRVLQNARLGALLRFYLNRAIRHRIMRPDAAQEAGWLLDRLDKGYRLDFTRTGLIFDLNGHGLDTEYEAGIHFHRVGREATHELIDAIETEPGRPPTAARPTSLTLADTELSIPRVTDAAFRAPARDHHIPDRDIPLAQSLPPTHSVASESAMSVPDSPLLRPGSMDLGFDPAQPRPELEKPDADPITSSPATLDGEPASVTGDVVPAPSRHDIPAQQTAPRVGAPDARPPVEESEASLTTPQPPDVLLGVTGPSPQYGILGDTAGLRVALDLNETHTISLFGMQGGGKSYTLGTIMEMAVMSRPPANVVPSPLAAIVFHYSQTQEYAPEFTSMVEPNDDDDQIKTLREKYGVTPAGLGDVVMLVPEDQLDERRAEFPDISVLPLRFGSAELRAEHWRFLMGAVGNQSTYIRQLQRIMRANRHNLRLDVIRQGIETSSLPDHLKQLAQQRLNLAADYVDDHARVKDLVRPGRMIIVDLRDEFIEKDEALGLFVVLMQLFAEAEKGGTRFNKLVVFDEAHKYMDSPDLVSGLVESVREMRHKGMSVLVASQDPPSVPISLIELSNHIILHKFTSPAWLKHLQKANAALGELTPAKMADLGSGEAYIWSSKATNPTFTRTAVKVRIRQRITKHGGGTKTAVERVSEIMHNSPDR